MAVKYFEGGKRIGGTTTYVCRICKHNTRNVGGDEAGVRLCLPCFDLGGIENCQSDSGLAEASRYRDEVVRSIAQIEARGKGDAGWRETFADMLQGAKRAA